MLQATPECTPPGSPRHEAGRTDARRAEAAGGGTGEDSGWAEVARVVERECSDVKLLLLHTREQATERMQRLVSDMLITCHSQVHHAHHGFCIFVHRLEDMLGRLEMDLAPVEPAKRSTVSARAAPHARTHASKPKQADRAGSVHNSGDRRASYHTYNTSVVGGEKESGVGMQTLGGLGDPHRAVHEVSQAVSLAGFPSTLPPVSSPGWSGAEIVKIRPSSRKNKSAERRRELMHEQRELAASARARQLIHEQAELTAQRERVAGINAGDGLPGERNRRGSNAADGSLGSQASEGLSQSTSSLVFRNVL